MRKDCALKYWAMSVSRSVWSEAFFFQQLPAPICTLNLSAPWHPAPSSTHRQSAHQLRTNSAFWSGVHGMGWEQGGCGAQGWGQQCQCCTAVARDRLPPWAVGSASLSAPCQGLTYQSTVPREVSLTFWSPSVSWPRLAVTKDWLKTIIAAYRTIFSLTPVLCKQQLHYSAQGVTGSSSEDMVILPKCIRNTK